jgi:hypothetical protein
VEDGSCRIEAEEAKKVEREIRNVTSKRTINVFFTRKALLATIKYI